jgi:hypothetical protein
VSYDLTEIDFLFSNAIALTANNKYCVIIRCPNGDADNYTEVGNEESGQFPCTYDLLGKYISSNDGGNSWASDSEYDLWYQQEYV